jgi:hypothetical protein
VVAVVVVKVVMNVVAEAGIKRWWRQ